MNCLLVFDKMTFAIHLIFTSLAGIIFRPHFTTFCSCFVIIFLEKKTFLQVRHIVLDLMFYEIPSWKKRFLGFTATSCLSIFSIVYHTLYMLQHLIFNEFLEVNWFNIFHMNCLLGFRKMTFTIHLIFTSHAGIIFSPLFTTFCSCFVITSLEKIKHIVLHLMFYEFLSKKESFLVSTATLLNCLPHSMRGTRSSINFFSKENGF